MKFSEIAEVYNANVANLDEARKAFEEEARNFIQTVNIFVTSEFKRANQDKTYSEFRYWNTPEIGSSKGATPLGFYSECRANLGIRPPGAKNFKNKGAYVSLQVSYDWSANQFMFKGVFTNSDEVNEFLDEKLAEIAQGTLESMPAAFKNFEVHKTKEYVAFKAPMNNEIWTEFGKIIQAFMNLCDKSVQAIVQAAPEKPKTEASPTPEVKTAV